MAIQPAPNLVVAERFRLTQMLGRGGMGSVWHAIHLGLDVPCAVKFIEGENSHLPEVKARFEREAKAAAALRSPHVVQILDHGIWDGTPYIAMELLEGEDLGKRLARVGRLQPHELLSIVTQVCRALSKAHAQGIVHRDLKPDNIFIVRDDDREIAKVLDFGIAKAGGPGASSSSTRTGAMLGTPYYMSPEQAQGTKAVDARSDLWSLAVIVFEALAGHRPFESEALGDLLMKIIVAPIPTPSQYTLDLPPALDAWWARASQRDPAQRFQSSKEFCDGLALVFGRSGSDVADQAPMGLVRGGASAPFGMTPQPGFNPPRPMAPHGMTPSQGYGAAYGNARPPTYGGPQQPIVDASTGAPIATTFGAAGVPGAKNRTAMLVLVAAGLAIVGAAIAGVSVAMKGKAEPVAASSRVTNPPVVATGVDAQAASAAIPPAVLSTTAPPETAPSVVPPPPAANTGPKPPPAVGKGPAIAKPPVVVRPPPPAAPTSEKKKAIDLGI